MSFVLDLLLASLDAARWSLAGAEKNGKRRLEEAVQIARGVREEMLGVRGAMMMTAVALRQTGWCGGWGWGRVSILPVCGCHAIFVSRALYCVFY